MLLLDKSIAFIRQKACFLTIKRMVLSAGNHENRPILSNPFTFTCYLLPMTYYRIAAGASRLHRDDDKNFRRNLTIEAPELRVVNSFWSLHTFRSQREIIRYAGFKKQKKTKKDKRKHLEPLDKGRLSLGDVGDAHSRRSVAYP